MFITHDFIFLLVVLKTALQRNLIQHKATNTVQVRHDLSFATKHIKHIITKANSEWYPSHPYPQHWNTRQAKQLCTKFVSLRACIIQRQRKPSVRNCVSATKFLSTWQLSLRCYKFIQWCSTGTTANTTMLATVVYCLLPLQLLSQPCNSYSLSAYNSIQNFFPRTTRKNNTSAACLVESFHWVVVFIWYRHTASIQTLLFRTVEVLIWTEKWSTSTYIPNFIGIRRTVLWPYGRTDIWHPLN